jgi:hypothetical protein
LIGSERQELQDNYRRVSHENLFILDPRGMGTSSIRLFESLRMGRRAREAWENWFSAEATFHRVTEWCLDIQASRSSASSRPYLKALPQCLSPRYARIVGSTLKRHLFQRRHQSPTASGVDVRA